MDIMPGCNCPHTSGSQEVSRGHWGHLAFLVVSCALFLNCHPKVRFDEPVANRAAPGWVMFRPSEANLYQGIGFATLSAGMQQSREEAEEAARKDLLAEIEQRYPSFLSSHGLTLPEGVAISWEDFGTTLKELPTRDTFLEEQRRRMWAYVTLTDAELQRLLSRRTRALEGKARRDLENANDELRAGDHAGALEAALAAYHRVSGPEGVLMTTRSGCLRTETDSLLSELLEDVSFRKVEGPEHARASGLRDTNLVVDAVKGSSGRPLENLPILFNFSKGAGSVDTQGVTDSKGRVVTQLRALDPRVSPVHIDATLDLDTLTKRARLMPLPPEAYRQFRIPFVRFSITLDPPRLLLTNIERGGTGGGRSVLIANELANALRKQGLEVQDANVDLLVNPDVFRKVEEGHDPGPVPDTDLIGVVAISLDHVRKQKGQFQEVFYGEGIALFRLYDLNRRVLLIDVRLEQVISGFSRGDVEQNFFLQSVDDLRSKVLDRLAAQPFTGL